jgi:hypothetical protein
MRQNNCFLLAVSLAAVFTMAMPNAIYADAISPSIKDTGKKYSKEPADKTYYGTGAGARLMEASDLRMDADRLMQDGEWDKAIVKAKKACQLDPGDPDTHMLLARAMTHKLQDKSGAIDQKLLAECMVEWKLIWLHDADNSDQMEGKGNYKKLERIQHGLDRQHKLEFKERQRAKLALAKQRAEQATKAELAREDKDSDESATVEKTSMKALSTKEKQANSNVKDIPWERTAKGTAATKELAAKKNSDDSTEKDSNDADAVQVAQHKRFWLF